MESYRAQIIVACVAIYFVLCIVVGLWQCERPKVPVIFSWLAENLEFL